MSSLEGKVIVVTGAGSGIGRATAIALAAQGGHLAITDINPTTICALAAELASPNHRTYTLDVSDPAQCNATVATIATDFTRVDGLFNCAGVNPTSLPLAATTDAYWDLLINTNLRGPYNMTRACIPHLRAGASIVNVSSTAGLRASAGYAIYNASKFGVIGFSKSMALELGKVGVRVNVVAPGSVETATNASVLEGEEAVRRAGEGIAMGRMGRPEEVADVVVFLMGEGARWVNGSVVEVTGGV